MKIAKPMRFIAVLAIAGALAGCGSIPKEQQKNYALVVSRVSQHGYDMDKVPASVPENTAFISYVDGKTIFPARPAIDLAPGEYRIQLGIGCNNTATCRPGAPYDLKLEAGKRYVLKPFGTVLVSDRFSDRAHEAPYTK